MDSELTPSGPGEQEHLAATSSRQSTPNARGEPPLEAKARHERRLEAVGSSALLGAPLGTEPLLAFQCLRCVGAGHSHATPTLVFPYAAGESLTRTGRRDRES
jgi:hypothetical protein